MNFQSLLIYGYIALAIAILLVFIFFSFYIKYLIVAKKKIEPFPDVNKNYDYVVLIPARNESKVISNILNSLKEQTYDKDHFKVFLITEKESDESNKIAKSYGYDYIVRKDLKHKKTKGYALKEGFDYLEEKQIKYDSIIIFDADNRLEKNYLSELNKLKNQGYQVGIGKRFSSNSNQTVISASSGLLFSFQTNFTNKARTKLFNKFAISGTGYYIDRDVIIDAGGWIFLGLTEDVELTRYCYAHGVNMGYTPHAHFFDEQPLDYKTMHTQHVRWIWGYFNKGTINKFLKGGKNYHKVPFLAKLEYSLAMGLFISSEFMVLLHVIFSLIVSIFAYTAGNIHYGNIFIICFFLEIILMFFICNIVTLVELMIVGKKFNATKKMRFKIFLYGSIFWSDFLRALLDGLFNKRKRHSRETIEHTGQLEE